MWIKPLQAFCFRSTTRLPELLDGKQTQPKTETEKEKERLGCLDVTLTDVSVTSAALRASHTNAVQSYDTQSKTPQDGNVSGGCSSGGIWGIWGISDWKPVKSGNRLTVFPDLENRFEESDFSWVLDSVRLRFSVCRELLVRHQETMTGCCVGPGRVKRPIWFNWTETTHFSLLFFFFKPKNHEWFFLNGVWSRFLYHGELSLENDWLGRSTVGPMRLFLGDVVASRGSRWPRLLPVSQWFKLIWDLFGQANLFLWLTQHVDARPPSVQLADLWPRLRRVWRLRRPQPTASHGGDVACQ